jgi:crotonobetainyl-CoA:carnitine CoA-transferase CaiB-like acyl-CoA transferase
MERLGLGYDKIKELNPSVVYAEVSGWGASGPYQYRKGQDLLGQGMSGGMFMIGEEDGPPQPSANYKADFVCGMQFTIGISMALMAKMRFGIGQRVHVSLLAGQIQAQDAEIFLNTGLITRDPQRHRIFRTKDGWVAAGLHFSEICIAADREDLTRDTRFDTLEKQMAHEDEWRVILEPIFLEKTTAEWDAVMAEKDLVGGPILSYEEAFTHPQVTHQNMIMDMEHPYGGSFKSVGLPIQLSETSMKVSRHPPALGEHTIEVLEGVGYSQEEIKSLIEEGTVQQYESGG